MVVARGKSRNSWVVEDGGSLCTTTVLREELSIIVVLGKELVCWWLFLVMHEVVDMAERGKKDAG